MTNRQSQQLKKKFLEAFRRHGNVTWAAKEAGLPYRTAPYEWQEHDDQFAAAFRDAEIEATEVLEAEAYRRGHDGVDEPVFHQGVAVGAVRKYSDTLLIFMLKARNPEKYRDRHDVKHSGEVKHSLTIADIRQAIGIEA
jgi:hypothetical protein